MNIQSPISISAGNAAQAAQFPDSSGGTSPGAGAGMRVDWNVRMNLSHAQGFVGGAGRLLVHNERPEERTELVLYLPGAAPTKPGTLELLTATICSAKPGMPVAQGQVLPVQAIGERAVVTIPALRMNDWVFIDLTWRGSFVQGGMSYVGGAVPVGDFHPQIAVDTVDQNGIKGLVPVSARYEVMLNTDPGAHVKITAGDSPVSSRTSDDGQFTEHEFHSYGSAPIQAAALPAGAVVEPQRPGTITGSASPVDAAATTQNQPVSGI